MRFYKPEIPRTSRWFPWAKVFHLSPGRWLSAFCSFPYLSSHSSCHHHLEWVTFIRTKNMKNQIWQLNIKECHFNLFNWYEERKRLINHHHCKWEHQFAPLVWWHLSSRDRLSPWAEPPPNEGQLRDWSRWSIAHNRRDPWPNLPYIPLIPYWGKDDLKHK